MDTHAHQTKTPRLRLRLWLFSGALLLLLVAAPNPIAAAQETGGSIRGRVTANGAPAANVRIVVQSPELSEHRETLTSPQGDYLFAFLPAGQYVVTFEREGLVTVKRTTRLSALETILADTTMAAAERPEESIVVTVDPETFPQSPAFSHNYQQTALERLPVRGGLSSALSLSSGPLSTPPDDVMVTLDGAPVRFGLEAPSLPLLDPGAVALRESTILTANVPTEAGQFLSGAIAIVTKQGGDRFSGALETTFASADMNADEAERSLGTEGVASGADYRIGGPLNGRRTWFFAAGRHLSEGVASQARLSDASFETRTKDRFSELKATHALSRDHRLQGSFVAGRRNLRDVGPVNARSVEDLTALEDRALSRRVLTAAYTGILWKNLQLTTRVTGEQARTETEGSGPTNLVARTAVRDQQSGAQMWAPGTCIQCVGDTRTSTTWRVAATYLLSGASDSHQVTAGYEGSLGRLEPPGVFNDGSFELLASRLLVENGQVIPVLEPNGSAAILWRPNRDNRLRHGSDAFYVADEWRRGSSVTFRAGVRWDRERLSRLDTTGRILTESGLSPNLSVTWHPSQEAGWILTIGYARYAADLLHAIDVPLFGQSELAFVYQGPPVNASGRNLVDTGGVVDGALRWFFANGGTGRAPSFAFEPGLTAVRPEVGSIPQTSEWAFNAGTRILGDAQFRADFIWRRAAEFRGWRVDPSTPTANVAGHVVDRATAADTSFTRTYTGLSLNLDYKLGIQASVAARYTLSRSWGNAVPSTAERDLLALTPFGYPEYVDADWAAPSGDLSDDRRHRLKFWGHADLVVSESLGTIGVAVVQTMESGRPYGLLSLVDVSPYVSNPGYLQPPRAVPYYFTARDEFRTESVRRTDLSTQYNRVIPGTLRSEIVVRFHILNLFNQRNVRDPEMFAVANTAFTNPTGFAPFNPFSQLPEPSVHWEVDPRFSDALTTAPMTMPRAYRISVGVRF